MCDIVSVNTSKWEPKTFFKDLFSGFYLWTLAAQKKKKKSVIWQSYFADYVVGLAKCLSCQHGSNFIRSY